MEKKLFSNSVFSPVIIGSSTGFGTNGDKHYEVVFSLAIVWMDGDDWIDIWEVIVIGQVIIIELQDVYKRQGVYWQSTAEAYAE